jgi:hypothetical protein
MGSDALLDNFAIAEVLEIGLNFEGLDEERWLNDVSVELEMEGCVSFFF